MGLSGWEIFQRIDRSTAVSDLKMELYPIRTGASHAGDLLAASYHDPFSDIYLVAMGVGAKKIAVMFNDNKPSVSAKSTPAVYHFTGGRGSYDLTARARDIQAFVATIR